MVFQNTGNMHIQHYKDIKTGSLVLRKLRWPAHRREKYLRSLLILFGSLRKKNSYNQISAVGERMGDWSASYIKEWALHRSGIPLNDVRHLVDGTSKDYHFCRLLCTPIGHVTGSCEILSMVLYRYFQQQLLHLHHGVNKIFQGTCYITVPVWQTRSTK